VKHAVVLMAYGSPETADDIRAYLEDIREGRTVSDRAVAELTERYRRIGGRSPLLEITEAQRGALEAELGVQVYLGMKHWRPRIAEGVERALADGAEMIVGLVLAPHYSRLSIGAYRRQLEDALDGRAELRFVERWGDEPGFVELLAERVRGTDAHVVFTAHSLPARILAEGDPYEEELLRSSGAVAERAGLSDWSFSYQSESATGEPWLGPDILDHLAVLKQRGVQEVLVCPIGFVADHLEIRWDLDTEAAERARQLGLGFSRIEMPNDDPDFVRVLAGIVERALVRAPVA
jgi:protoporphyrin/coproporphyrin ferrochelatase